ncbi:MFS transporter [Kitasatospora sp. NPDC057518]|uniref:MFS transporter n=1 Tax=Kitasatospora sp. NPDC057518 TaxID=3346155 RepID=UPI003683C42B
MLARVAAAARVRPPERTGALLSATLVLSVGKGAFLATVMVYLLQIVGLTPLLATAGLTLWGAASAAVAVPTGLLVDRGRGRAVGSVAAVCAALLVPLSARVHTPWALLLVLCVAGGFDSAGNVVRRAMLAGAGGDSVKALAWARTVTNIGFALGALCSVRLLASRSPFAYETAYLLIGGGYLVMAACFATTSLGAGRRGSPSVRAPGVVGARSLRTGGALAAATGILTVHTTLLSTVLPLWVTRHASVPVSVLGWLVMLNSLIAVGGQLAVSRRAATREGALRCFRNSAVWTAGCCLLLGLVRFAPTGWQVVLLVAATIALTGGELLEAAGEWGLSAVLAAADEHGFYQSACVLGETTQGAAGPLLVAGLVTAAPVAGWIVLVAVLGAGRYIAGFTTPPPHKAIAIDS